MMSDAEMIDSQDAGQQLARLRAIMHRLRAPGGCPWDAEQTHESLVPNLIEEAYETVDTIQRGDHEHLKEELGDLLLQVVFHSELAEEAGRFTLDDVARGISEKLVRRHPHVFGESNAATVTRTGRRRASMRAASAAAAAPCARTARCRSTFRPASRMASASACRAKASPA